MKPSSSFKMSKTTKRMLSLFPFSSVGSKNQFKRQMITSQLTAELAQRTSAKVKDTDTA
jgi:hypothetical protein